MDSFTAQALFLLPHFAARQKALAVLHVVQQTWISDCSNWLVRKSKTKSEACRVVLLIRYSSNTQKSSLLISHIKASGITKLKRFLTYLILRFRNSTANLSLQQRRERCIQPTIF